MRANRLAKTSNIFEEESEARGPRRCNKAIESSWRNILAWMACANDRCDEKYTRSKKHVHNMQVSGPNSAHSLDTKYAKSSK